VDVNVPPRISDKVRGENGSYGDIIPFSNTAAAGVHTELRLAILIIGTVRRALLENDKDVRCLQSYHSYVGFEVLGAVAVESSFSFLGYNVV
jgi:hypothetical protein